MVLPVYPITPVVPLQDPPPHSITTQDHPAITIGAWYANQTITEIPKDAVGWLVAQGWEIDTITWDYTTKPKTAYYTMIRESFLAKAATQGLIDEYVFQYNAALNNNEGRYNLIVAGMDAMIVSSQDQFIEQAEAQTEHAEGYLGDLKIAMDAVKLLIETNEDGDTDTPGLVKDIAVATTGLTALDAKLADFEANYGATADILTGAGGTTGLLGDQQSYLAAFLNNFILELAKLSTNNTAHVNLLTTLIAKTGTDLETTFKGVQDTQLTAIEEAYTHASTGLVKILDDLLVTADAYTAEIAGVIGGALGELDTVLNLIGTDYTAVALEVNDLLDDEATALGTHVKDYNSEIGTLLGDHTAHVGLATAFLTNLGETELARINEKFAASLSTQLQQLVDRGLYSSAVAADITARNTRDHNEEIVALNDRLNREKFDNQHQLYGQQVTMRHGTMDGKARVYGVQNELLRYRALQATGLHALEQSVRDRTLAGKQALYAIRDSNNRLHIELKNVLYNEGQKMRKLLIEEAARIHQLRQSLNQWTASQRDRLLEQIQSVVEKTLEGLAQQHAAAQAITAAAISQRNTMLQQIQDAANGLVAGKNQFAALTAQNATALSDQRHRMVAERMNEEGVRMSGEQKKHEEDMALMAYQLGARNELLVGFFGFIERRDDVGPEMADLTKLVSSLGDSGGGWISP